MNAEVEVDVANHVMTLTLNRAENLNAFTLQMMQELLDAFDDADRRDEVRAVVVTGRGRGFCAGADLASGAGTFDQGVFEPSGRAPRDGGGRVALKIFGSSKPVIGAINGPAVGVGITMCLPMDIRIASTNSKFGFVFVRRGIVPEATSTWFLPRIVGLSKAMEWFSTGRLFGPDEAASAGLVSRVVTPDDLLPAAYAAAEEIAAHSAPVSVALTRQMVLHMAGAAHPMEAHRIDSLAMLLRGSSDDAKEGVQSFLERRPASFPLLVSRDLPDLGLLDPTY